ncbi:MAG TPA: glycerate kinase [Acidimicrobiales bacterium]|nr:glycerate kinase [Acidimicrobiales bacterium]
MPRLVVAPDKFRGSATATDAAEAIGAAATRLGWSVDLAPVSDGGEGFCQVLGGRARPASVHGPLGETIESAWYELDGGATAAIEMAMASGLVLAGGEEANDPMRADTRGVGELIAAAVKGGARHLLVGMGGSASTDGGWGAIEVLEPISRLAGVHIEVACDVRTRFVDAAAVFAPQKGATPAQVEMLTRRLERLVQLYQQRFGRDVTELVGAGAAGGLAGGLAAIGGELTSGFDLVADRIDLAGRIEGADLVITGEGLLDDQSFEGKSVGGVVELAAEFGVPVAVIAGDSDTNPDLEVRTLIAEVGEEAAMTDTLTSLGRVTEELLAGRT